jgi:mRNA interferase RelE/StbE
LAWQIEIDAAAQKDLGRLDHQNARRVLAFLRERLALSENPRRLGTALQGEQFEHLWRYRVGDYRVICEIQDDRLVILAVAVGHRKEVYR